MAVSITMKEIRKSHKYFVAGDPRVNPEQALTSCSTISKFIDGGANDGLLYWAFDASVRQGTRNGFKIENERAMEAGNEIHSAIYEYIGTEGKSYPADVPPVFGKWLAYFGERVQEWIASEMYVYSPSYLYGGTLDAIGTIDGQNVLLDWKTTTRVRASGTTKKKDDLRYKSHATQLGGYWLALSEMELDFEMPTSAGVCYIMHDSDEIDIHWIDLEASVEAFKASLACYNATGGLFLK